MYLKLYKFLLRTKVCNLFAIGIFLPLFIGLAIILMHHLFPDIFIFGDDDTDIIELVKQNPRLLVSVILIGPFAETLLQYVPVKMSTYISRKRSYIAIFLSAIVFAFLHNGSLMIFVPIFFTGFVWAALCLILIKRRVKPYLSITAMHAGYNAILFVMDYIIY